MAFENPLVLLVVGGGGAWGFVNRINTTKKMGFSNIQRTLWEVTKSKQTLKD